MVKQSSLGQSRLDHHRTEAGPRIPVAGESLAGDIQNQLAGHTRLLFALLHGISIPTKRYSIKTNQDYSRTT